jgi:hypothetical protein
MVYRFHADHHGEVFAEAKRDDTHILSGNPSSPQGVPPLIWSRGWSD